MAEGVGDLLRHAGLDRRVVLPPGDAARRRTRRSSTTTTGCRMRRRSGPAPCRRRTGSGSRRRASRSPRGHLSRYFADGRASRPTPTSPISTPPTAQGDRGHRTPRATTSSTGSSATTPICRSSSTPPTPTAPPWRTSPCSIWSASSSRRASATSARSPCTAPGPPRQFERPLPARRAAADPAPEHRADRRALGRPAARRRVGASTGTPPPRWSSASCARRNAGRTRSTAAIKEYGALRRTIYAARYLADETYRRAYRPPAQQGREPALAAPRPGLRQRGRRRGGATTSSRPSRCGA